MSLGVRMEDYPVGCRCDVYDNGTWRTAKVLSQKPETNQVYITFEGWPSNWDIWVDMSYGTQRIAPLWTKVEKGKYTGDPKNPPDLGYDLADDDKQDEYKQEMQILLNIKKTLEEGKEALDEKQLTWFCQGKYVVDMLRAKVNKQTWKQPFVFLETYLSAAVAAIKSGLAQLHEDMVLNAVKNILGYYLQEDDGLRAYFDSIQQLLTKEQCDGDFASLPPSQSPDAHRDPPARVILLNKFGAVGGFDVLRDRLLTVAEDYREGRKGRNAKGFSFSSTSFTIKMLRGMKYLLHEEKMSEYFASLRVDESDFMAGVLQSLNRDQVYAIAGKGKQLFDDFVDDVSSIIRGAQKTKGHTTKYIELAQLDLILFLIKAPYIVAQRRGMQLIKLYIKVLNPKKWEIGDKVTAQYKKSGWYKGKITAINPDGTYNVEFDDGDTEDHLQEHQVRPHMTNEAGGFPGYNQEPEEDPPKLSYLDGEMFIQWLEKNKVIDLISTDPRLFLHSSPIFKFLASNKQLSDAHLDILLSQAKTAEGSELMSQLAEQMDEKTLTSMYKRQTDGIEYGEYQPWQLDALTKFTLSAVKATNGAHFYGLNLFWDMLKPENESKLHKDIIKKATACLNQLFESELLASKREEYINMCVQSLTGNSGEVNALTVFQILMKGLTPDETAEKIEVYVKKFNLLVLFFKNCRTYNESTSKVLTANPKDDKDPKKLPQDRILRGVSTHKQQLWSRLQFIRFLGQQSNLSLEEAEIDAMWELFVTESVCEFDTQQFMKWLPQCLKESKEVYAMFSPKSRAHLFTKLSSKHVHKKTNLPVKVTPEWQRCFTSCFLSTNHATLAIDLEPLSVINHQKLQGKDQLWEFALREPEESVRKASQKFLGSMYIKFAHKEMPEKAKIAALDEFVTMCMESLLEGHEKNDTNLMQATLELINSVLGRINVGEMIKRPLYKKGENIQAHWKRNGGTLYEATIKAVNEDGTYHLLYKDGDVDPAAPEAYLREMTGNPRIPEPVKLSAVEQHVQNTLAGEKKYFNRIFSSLDEGGVIGALAWDLLLLLPPSDAVVSKLRSLHKEKNLDWNNVLPPAPVKLLYSLQILSPSQVEDKTNPLNNPKWCKVFVEGGLPRLASILQASSSQLVADNLALCCLAQVHAIMTWFLTDGGKAGIDTKSVLAKLDLKSVVDVSLKMVSSIVVPDKLAMKGKAAALKSLFELLAIGVIVQPTVFSQIKEFGSEWEKIVVTALITNKFVIIQKAFTDGINLLCSSTPDDSQQVSKLREELRDKLLEVTNARFAELDTQTNCAQYLLLMRNLIANTEEIEQKSAKEIGASLAQLIRRHPMTESTPKTQDHVLGALLNLTAELIKKVPALRDTMGASGPKQTSLLKPVYDMLFKVPTLENSYHLKIRPPQCKHHSTRRAGFALLSALSCGNEKNLEALTVLLLPHHLRIHSNGKKPYSWEFEPAWRSDEQEREGYCGIVNCGNTCYINAALQQVFMQPKLRENILAIHEYAHPNPQRPQWKRDELEGLQWLLGNLQESNKRAIRPMYFHERFEDPDWENQGKPVRGKGAAGCAQADSNGFLQTLLGRVEDRIKKTNFKDTIKSVCGLQFVDQIVGSRAAPYLNYKYSVDNWVGPISLNVNGHRTLHECLKSHVEFKQQNRKVSNEGVFGQKYDKNNVQVFKRTVFRTMPQCLMICLNRMGYDNMGNTLKLNHRISFPTSLNMKPYSEEALFEKLPRGSDTGASAKSDSKVKIEKPSSHTDEYYKYELMGVIVHAGRTLQSGHYYSYIRERPPSNKWYCFNDSSISPFDANKLEEETFGSADTDSWKCSTAYVLFYDKVPQPKTVVTVNKQEINLGFAGAGLLIAKAKKAQKEATQKVKARVTVPQGMLRRIWDENEIKWRDTNVHDRNYGVALWEMLSSFIKANPKPPTSQPSVDAITESPANLYDNVTRLVTRYLFMTLARSKGRAERGWAQWVKDVKGLYAGNVASSVWLVSMFANPQIDWFSTLLMADYDSTPQRTPVQEVRHGACEVLTEALRTLASTEKRFIVKAAASSPSGKRRVRSSTPKRLGIMEHEGKGKSLDEKEGQDEKEAAPVKEIVARPGTGYVLTIIDRVVNELALQDRMPTAGYEWIRLLAKFNDFGKEEAAYLASVKLFEDLVAQVDAQQETQIPDSVSDQLPNEYFSLLLSMCKTSADFDLISRPHFIKRLLHEAYEKARAKPISALVCSMCNKDPNKLALVLDCVSKGISDRNHELTRPFYRVLAALVADPSAKDSKERATKVMGTLCGAFFGELKFKEGDFLCEHIIRLAKRFPSCAAFLKASSAGVEKIIKYLKERPEEKETIWKVGEQVVSRYKAERGVYPGDIFKVNGDGTYYIKYDDGDVWDAAPGDKIRPRLHPRVANRPASRELDAADIKCLQYVLRNCAPPNSALPASDDLPEMSGVLDELTVNALMDFINQQTFDTPKTGKLDVRSIKILQAYLQRNLVDQLKNPNRGYPDDTARLDDEDGMIGPLTVFYLRKWLDSKVSDHSTQVAKRELAGHIKKHEALRDSFGYHVKDRRYTITCEFAPYSRPIAAKIQALVAIAHGKPLTDSIVDDSEDERDERKFKVGDKIDAWDTYSETWKVATVHRIFGDKVTIRFERSVAANTRSMEPLMVTASQWDRTGRAKLRARFHTYSKGDPHLYHEAETFSKLKG